MEVHSQLGYVVNNHGYQGVKFPDEDIDDFQIFEAPDALETLPTAPAFVGKIRGVVHRTWAQKTSYKWRGL